MSLSAPGNTQLTVEATSVMENPEERRHRKSKGDQARGSHHRRRRPSAGKEKKRWSTTGADASISSRAAVGSLAKHCDIDVDDEENWEVNRCAVERLCAQYPNNVCADCGEAGTRWASVNHGVFVCIRCAGVHRSLGVHISKVKSTNMDRWLVAEVRLMEAIGNTKAKALYEARLPAGVRPSGTAGAAADDALKAFIERKYAQREFAMHNLRGVLGGLYKDTRYGKAKRVPTTVTLGESSASLSTRGGSCTAAPIDRAAVSGRRGDTVRAFYGDATTELQRGLSKRNKEADALSSAASAPRPTYGAFGMVNVPPEDYEARLQRTVALFARLENSLCAEVAQTQDMPSGDEEGKEVSVNAVVPLVGTPTVLTDDKKLDDVEATPPPASASLSV